MATILVADDEELVCKLAARILSTVGHQVLTASNGLEAVALYRSFHHRIDLVVTDLDMPVMDGRQAIHLIHETRPDAKIICISAHPNEECPEGVVFLRKPFSMHEFLSTVNALLPGVHS